VFTLSWEIPKVKSSQISLFLVFHKQKNDNSQIHVIKYRKCLLYKVVSLFSWCLLSINILFPIDTFLFLPLFKFAGWPFVINSFLFVHFLSLYLIIPLCHVVYCLFLLYSDFCFSLTENVCKFKLYLILDSHFLYLFTLTCRHFLWQFVEPQFQTYLKICLDSIWFFFFCKFCTCF
jgi:hypothetical protein